MGQRATQDVVTPVPLIVVDPDRTERIRLQEAQRIPPLLRLRADAATEAQFKLQLAFAENREIFLDALRSAYKRTTLQSNELSAAKFERFVSKCQRQARAFPLTTNLAQLWALGESDESIQADLACRLGEAMGRYIRSDQLPVEAKIGPAQWRVLSGNSDDAVPRMEMLQKSTKPVYRTNVVPLARARKELISTFPLGEQLTARFLASLLRENCFIDADATRLLRASRTNELWAADHYAAGQTIIKAGETIDGRAKAAIDKLEEKAAADRAQIELVHALGKAQASMSSLKEEKESARRQLWWMSLLAIPGVGAGLVIWRMRRNEARDLSIAGREIALVTNGEEASAVSRTDTLPVVVRFWRARALAAERRVRNLTYALRVRLAPHLARWMAQKFVQQLLSNRGHLLEIQQQAEAEIAQLEKRLAEMQAPLQERMRAYEERIVRLEEQLLSKDQQNRELVQFAIASARVRLERERMAGEFDWD